MLKLFQKLLFIGFIFALTFVGAEKMQLRSVSILFRHGDRTPWREELNYIGQHANKSFYPEGYGQLTNGGKNRAFRLGQYLRERYNDFLGPIYTPEILHAQSSDYDRTKSSLQLVLAGLFPPISMQIWNENLKWQSIPFHYNHIKNDSLLVGDNCPRYREEFEIAVNSPEFIEEQTRKFGAFFKNATCVTGIKIEHTSQIRNLYFGVTAISHMNLTLPDCAHELFSQDLFLDAVLFDYKVQSYNDKMKKLLGGQLVKKISEDFMTEMNGTSVEGHKMYLYSGHEITIAALLNALAIPVTEVPYYSSAIMMELRNNRENDYFVQLFYRAENQESLKELQIPGCDKLCPLDTFLELTNKVWPSDEETICQRSM